MKKAILVCILGIIMISGSLSAAPSKYFLMCVDCSQSQAQSAARNHIRTYPNTYLEMPISVYTNTGSEYGYSFTAMKEEWLAVASPLNTNSATRALFKGLHDYVEEYKYMITETQADINAQYMAKNGFPTNYQHQKFTSNFETECKSEDSKDSPFDYFKANNANIIDSQLNAMLVGYQPSKEGELQSLGVSAGFSQSNGFEVGGSATISVQNEVNVLDYTWANGGVSRFVVTQNAGQWGVDFNLAGSRLGLGLYEGETLPGSALSQYVIENADGSHSVKGGTFQFFNKCLEKDFEDMIAALGMEIDNSSLDAAIEELNSVGGSCSNPQTGPVTYMWTDIVQTYRVVGNVVTIIASVETVSLSVDSSPGHPCDTE